MHPDCDRVAVAEDIGRQPLTPDIRRLPTRTLLALNLLGQLSAAPYLLQDRNGSGREFLRMCWTSAGGCPRRIYIGALPPNDEHVLRQAITDKWPVTRHGINRTIRTLRRRRQELRHRAQHIAARCGYGFRGWALHKETRRCKLKRVA